MSKQDLKHWYCFSFSGFDENSKKQCQASSYTGYADRNISMARIRENKAYAGVSDNAVLISCSYLGRMTKSQFAET